MKIITGGVYVAVFNSERSDQSPVPMTSHKLYSHLKTPTTRIISGRVHVAVYSENSDQVLVPMLVSSHKLCEHRSIHVLILLLPLLVVPVLAWV